jgi:hypothetical protein
MIKICFLKRNISKKIYNNLEVQDLSVNIIWYNIKISETEHFIWYFNKSRYSSNVVNVVS